MTELLILAAVMLVTGAVGGVLAGLLGIGGGIVIVPALDFALSFLDVDASIRMHIAVDSLCCFFQSSDSNAPIISTTKARKMSPSRPKAPHLIQIMQYPVSSGA